MVNLLLVSPLTNIVMVVLWAGAGFVGGLIAGTKKGAFVVGLLTWLSCIGALVFCFYLILTGGVSLGTFPPIPPGTSLVDILSIPILQDMIAQLLPLIGGIGGGGGMPDITTLILPLVMWIVVPVIVIIVAGIVGAIVRPKEDF